MSRNGVGWTAPLTTVRIRPLCSTTNWTERLVGSGTNPTGAEKPEACNVARSCARTSTAMPHTRIVAIAIEKFILMIAIVQETRSGAPAFPYLGRFGMGMSVPAPHITANELE